MKTLLKIAAFLIIAVLVYNYFAGTPSEKAQSEKIFNEVKDLGSSVADLVKDEHKKFCERYRISLSPEFEKIFIEKPDPIDRSQLLRAIETFRAHFDDEDDAAIKGVIKSLVPTFHQDK